MRALGVGDDCEWECVTSRHNYSHASKEYRHRPNMMILDRVVIALIEIGITSQDRLQAIKSKKKWKYCMLLGNIGLTDGCLTKIVSGDNNTNSNVLSHKVLKENCLKRSL